MMSHNHSHDVNFGIPPDPPKMMCAIHSHVNLYSILYAPPPPPPPPPPSPPPPPPAAILNLPCLLPLNQLSQDMDSSLDYILHLHYRTETGVKSPGAFEMVVSTVARDCTFIIVARFHMQGMLQKWRQICKALSLHLFTLQYTTVLTARYWCALVSLPDQKRSGDETACAWACVQDYKMTSFSELRTSLLTWSCEDSEWS